MTTDGHLVEEKHRESLDRFERLVSELSDFAPEGRWLAVAILELIRSEVDRINTSGKIRP